jgi:uncharacterized protein (DUF433 family)
MTPRREGDRSGPECYSLGRMIKVKRALFTEAVVDPRELPAYNIAEAARYLRIPEATLRSWVAGRPYPTSAGQRFFRPVIYLPEDSQPVLSFTNMIEAHVLEAIRRKENITLRQVRTAVAFLERHYHSRHPLAEHQFETGGLDLFIRKAGLLINLSQSGQLVMREVVAAYLRRIERDVKGLPIRLYPFTRKREPEEPRAVVIDPFVSFGRPVLTGTGITTAILAERFKAGESVEELAKDYGRTALDIQEALRCELPLEAA